jgi:hypothetical protein
MAENCCYNKILMIFFVEEEKMKTREGKRMVKLKFLFFSSLFKTAIMGHVLKNPTHSLFGAWSFLLVHIWFTHSEGPKGSVN